MRGMTTPDDGELRRAARAAIQQKQLPATAPARTWGGPASGSHCAVCGKELTPDDMVFDLEFVTADRPTRDHQMHVRCFRAWDTERRALHPAAAAPTLPNSEDPHATLGIRE
jgi:hypothetical protein